MTVTTSTTSTHHTIGAEHTHTSATETVKLCLVEIRVRAQMQTKTYGQIIRKRNEMEGWGHKGLFPKYEQAMLFDRVPLPWKVSKYKVGGVCFYCGNDTSEDFPGPIYRTNHRGKEVEKSKSGYCQVCGEDLYALQIVKDEEYKRWKGMRVQKQLWPIRVLKMVLAIIPLVNLIPISALEGTRIESTEGLITTGRPYKDSERFTTDDMTDEALLELQAYHLSKAWGIGQQIQKNRQTQ